VLCGVLLALKRVVRGPVHTCLLYRYQLKVQMHMNHAVSRTSLALSPLHNKMAGHQPHIVTSSVHELRTTC
jgi:hypothetical protein